MKNNKIYKISTMCIFISKVSMLLFPILMLLPYFVGFPDFYPDSQLYNNIISKNNSKMIMLFSNIISLLFYLVVIFNLKKLFLNYRNYIVFNLQNILIYKKLSYITLFYAFFLDPFSQALLSVAKTINNGVGQRMIQVTLSQFHFGLLFLSIILILISYVMQEGLRLKEDGNLVI